MLRFGEIVDVKTEPGIYFKAPFAFFDADNVQIIEDRLLRFDLDNIRVQVSGGKFYEVDAFVAYRISDPRTLPRGGVGQRDRLPSSGCAPASTRRCAASTACAASNRRCPKSAPTMMREVRDQLRPDAELARPRDRGRAHPPHRPDGRKSRSRPSTA